MTATTFELTPIAHVRCARAEAIDDGWDAIPAEIVLDAAVFGPEALAGLDSFSHVEVLYLFHKVADSKIVWDARHPRGRTDWPKIGIFAQRGKNRPNRLGATVCRIEKIDGLSLFVRGLDAIDGTPVLDLKPCMTAFLPRGPLREPDWVGELMRDYWTGDGA